MTLHLELNGCQAIRLMLDENVIQEKMLMGGKETLDLELPIFGRQNKEFSGFR